MRLSILLLCALLASCTIVPFNQLSSACDLLKTASEEADLAPAWYLEAGKTLHACGVPNALEDAQERACLANRRNGYTC